MELQFTKQMKRIVIRDKRGRRVPILFTLTLQKVIQVLLKTREIVIFINKNNPYLFALPNSMNCLRGSDVIHKLSVNSGIKNPENILSTKLRKQIPTIAQLLNFFKIFKSNSTSVSDYLPCKYCMSMYKRNICFVILKFVNIIKVAQKVKIKPKQMVKICF